MMGSGEGTPNLFSDRYFIIPLGEPLVIEVKLHGITARSN